MSNENNVIHLPRPKAHRPSHGSLGLYIRAGWTQHVDLIEVMAAGERDFHGIIVDAGGAARQHELIQTALDFGLDVALDPKTQPMALPGGYSSSMADLPWGLDRPHTLADFAGDNGRDVAKAIVQFATEHKFTQILAPTHILTGVNDPWFQSDQRNLRHMRVEIDEVNSELQLFYPLTVPIKVLRERTERAAIVSAMSELPIDALWLRIENFGSDATGDKTVSYIEAARDFHQLGIPIVADFVGGISSLGLLAFGAVGGLAHGVTLFEGYKVSHWRRPPREGRGGMPATRVYVPKLDMHLPISEAESFLRSSTRTTAHFGCTDTHCCPGGISDMLNNPLRHLVHRRSQQIQQMSAIPETVRPRNYVNDIVRPVTDGVAKAASLGAISEEMRKKLLKKQKAVGLYRDAMTNFANNDSIESSAQLPLRRNDRSQS